MEYFAALEVCVLAALGLVLLMGGAAPLSSAPHPSEARPVWLAKAKKKKAATAPASSLAIATDLPQVEIKVKKRRVTALAAGPGDSVRVNLAGPGKLTVVVYQVLDQGGQALVNTFRNGKPERGMSFKGQRYPGASASSGQRISRPKTSELSIASGEHVVEVKLPPASSAVLVEIQYFPAGARRPAPLVFQPASTAVAAAPPGPPNGPASTEVMPPPTPPGAPVGPVAAPAAAPAAKGPFAQAEAAIESGKRDMLVGSYPTVVLRRPEAPEQESFHWAKAEQPLQFVADGPGIVTVRVHRFTRGDATPVRLTILENDILLQAVDLDTPLSDWVVEGRPELKVCAAKEYRLTLAPKLSRFVIQTAESMSDGMAIRYTFEPQEKGGAMALTLDLGEEIGGADLAGSTVLTEVAIRETVRVIRVGGGDEFLGVGVGGGVFVPQWRGRPAYAAGLQIRLTLPPLDRFLALSFDATAQMQNLVFAVADPQGAPLDASARVLSLPAFGSFVFRFIIADVLGLHLSLGGGMVYVQAESTLAGTTRRETAWVPAGRAGLALELKAGPGWLSLDGGYVLGPTRDLGSVASGYSPSGFPVALRYRLGL
ncbi:MAG: hypothetical protein HYZ27_00425 [Deltaproteobacteria bacterium]|nr:hypothetical protein [Deltaproteobacteria bacterium]